MIAEEVEHPVHGNGRLVSLRRSGRLALVDFASLPLPTLVPTRELRRLDQPAADSRSTGEAKEAKEAKEASDAAPAAGATATLGRYALQPTEADMAIEAMRLGVV